MLICVCLCGCDTSAARTKSPPPAAVRPEVLQVAVSYSSLRAMTPKPVLVNPQFAALCAGVSTSDVDAAALQFGPHAHTAVSIFMNDLAANTFGRPDAVYPVGSIIVKEKKSLATRVTKGPDVSNGGVGGMIKREPGYDPSHGDWEYFYFEKPDKIEQGKIESCVQCHSGAAPRDYVFGGWSSVLVK